MQIVRIAAIVVLVVLSTIAVRSRKRRATFARKVASARGAVSRRCVDVEARASSLAAWRHELDAMPGW